MGRTIGIVSLKGGVGKTTSVVSLGAALSDIGKKVLLVDGNLSAPNLGTHLNVIDPEVSLHHVLSREVNPSEAVHTLEKHGLDLIPATIFNRKLVNPLKLKDRIKSLKNKYDITLIDSSPALNEETLAAMNASDELLVVTTPDYPTLAVTLKAIKDAKKKGVPISGIILNKVHNKRFELSLDDIEHVAEVPVVAVIPHDIGFKKALSKFMPYFSYKPNSKGGIEFKKLASALVGERFDPFSFRKFLNLSPEKQEINREVFYQSVFR